MDKCEDNKLQLLTNWEDYKSQIYCLDRDQVAYAGSNFNELKAKLKTFEKNFSAAVHNIRTQDRIDMSINLTADQGWWVFRSGRWYAGNHPHPPPPDIYPEEGEEDADGDQQDHAPQADGAAGGAQY